MYSRVTPRVCERCCSRLDGRQRIAVVVDANPVCGAAVFLGVAYARHVAFSITRQRGGGIEQVSAICREKQRNIDTHV